MRLAHFLARENMSFLTYNKICNFMVDSYGVELSGVHRQDNSFREFIKFLARAALEINIKDAFLRIVRHTITHYSLMTVPLTALSSKVLFLGTRCLVR